MAVASGDCGHIAEADDYFGDGGSICGSIPQLARRVLSPAPCSAAEQSGAVVMATSGDADYACKIDDSHRGKRGSGIREGAVP